MRTFETGATRDSNEHKPDYSGFLSPKAIRRFGEYMQKKQVMDDGSRRSADNWKKGLPVATYVESGFRHMIEFWDLYEEGKLEEADEVACAILFNVQGYLHERTKTAALHAAPTWRTCSDSPAGSGLGCTRPLGHVGEHWATDQYEPAHAPAGEVYLRWFP